MAELKYRQWTEEEARVICERDGKKYYPRNLPLYKYPTKESFEELKKETPFAP